MKQATKRSKPYDINWSSYESMAAQQIDRVPGYMQRVKIEMKKRFFI